MNLASSRPQTDLFPDVLDLAIQLGERCLGRGGAGKIYPHKRECLPLLVKKLGGVRCDGDEGVDVNLRAVYLRLEFGQVFMKTGNRR